jgi:uncharacterized membrane protein YeaQ/YmgE (transglycosylase-associated protein family)
MPAEGGPPCRPGNRPGTWPTRPPFRAHGRARIGRPLAQERTMSIIGWIILGLIAGFIASKIVNNRGEGFFGDIILGVIGALVGGFLFSAFGGAGVTGFNLYSLMVAVIGSIVVLVVYHAIRRPG